MNETRVQKSQNTELAKRTSNS